MTSRKPPRPNIVETLLAKAKELAPEFKFSPQSQLGGGLCIFLYDLGGSQAGAAIVMRETFNDFGEHTCFEAHIDLTGQSSWLSPSDARLQGLALLTAGRLAPLLEAAAEDWKRHKWD